MRITVTNTTKIVEVNGVPARVWEGTTESGIPIVCLITRIAVHKEQDTTQFERELEECKPPSPIVDQVYPTRLVL